MHINIGSYIFKSSPIHACDARIKILLLLVYFIALFLVKTWAGQGICALLLLGVIVASRIPPTRFLSLLLPVYVIVFVTVLFNSFSLDITQLGFAGVPGMFKRTSPGPLSACRPVALLGSFGFVPAGFSRGCFLSARILILVIASLVISYTTTSTDMLDAISSFLHPLRRVGVPADDIAMVFSLALRFIPVMTEEFSCVRAAHIARGASFDTGSIQKRLGAWQMALIPLFVRLFRRADTLAIAMDARCYGLPKCRRTSINSRELTVQSFVVLAIGLGICIALAAFL